MKYLRLIVLPLLCSAVHANAQYLDNSMRWVQYTIGVGGFEYHLDYIISIESDTIIDGTEYYIMERSGIQRYYPMSMTSGTLLPPVVSVISNRVGFLREEGTRFYLWQDNSEDDYLLLDFDIQVGGYYGGLVVNSIDTVMFGSSPRRRYWTLYGYAIEGIGHIRNGLGDPSVQMIETGTSLNCAMNSSMSGGYLMDSLGTCDPFENFSINYQLPCYGQPAYVAAGTGSSYLYEGVLADTLYFDEEGIYSAELVHDVSGVSFPIQLVITAHVPDTVPLSVSGDLPLCPGESVSLCAPSGFLGYSSSIGTTTQCFTISPAGCGGVYSMVFWDSEGCLYYSEAITVECLDSVHAGFDVDMVGETVTFINLSANASSFHWDFGNGSTSDEEDPTAVLAPGMHEVCLIASGSCGADTVCQMVNITTSLTDLSAPRITMQRSDRAMTWHSSDSELNMVAVMDMLGRTVASTSCHGNTCSLELPDTRTSEVLVARVLLQSGESRTFRLVR
jgi:hypothetical protein